jgi:hypothetical protein
MNDVGTRKFDVWYLSRIPLRKVKQGLCMQAISCRKLGTREDRTMRTGGSPIQRLMFSQNFVDLVMGKYPTLKEVMNNLRAEHAKDNSKIYQLAVSRDIALEINEMGVVNVHYKNQFVGWIQPDAWVVHVPRSDKSWVVSRYLAHVLDWTVD